MKTIISFFLLALMTVFPLTAQKGSDLLKKAKKAQLVFKVDNSNKAKLVEATNAIDLAIKDPAIIQDAEVWLVRGTIYSEIASQRLLIQQLGIGDISELPKVEYPALEAMEAFKKGRSIASKRSEADEALKGLRGVQNYLTNEGVYAAASKNYAVAHRHFYQVLQAHKLLKDAGAESALDSEGQFDDHLYYSGLTALNAGMNSTAKIYFDELYLKKYDNPAIYEALYNIATADDSSDINDSYKYLAEGRKMYPGDTALLFAEINHFLRTNQLDELVSKLEKAIEKEPENVSLYTTLGNVYDNLYQREAQGGDPDLENLYFNNALSYYKQGIARDAKNAEAQYSIAALYYNKAAIESKALMVLADDFSSEGVKKYEQKQTEIMAIFDQALPYFKKAESLNPNDISTLIALKEIYARKDDLATSNIFKDRLNVVQNGGKNETSHFNN